MKANINVNTAPPMNPSHVFFGDSFISGVFPTKNPTKYAHTSLHTTQQWGNASQKNPL